MDRAGRPGIARVVARASAAAFLLAACQATDERFAPARVQGPGHPDPKALEVYEVWEWKVESGRLFGALPSPSDGHRAGLRVAVTADAGLPGDADAHQVVEGRPVAIPVAAGRWPAGAWPSPATSDPMWAGAKVRVAWQVRLLRRTTCSVEIEAIPRLEHATGCYALLTDLAVRRVVSLDEALVIGTDPAVKPDDPKGEAAALLVGAAGGTPARLVFRVRD